MQCHRQQKLVDKMIPIYFTDSTKVSQIFISDKVTKSTNSSALQSIYRGEPSINCATEVPYIAILVDFGTPKSEFKATWYPCRDNDGPSLRIYAAAIDKNTFPFLERHRIIYEFRDLASAATTDEPITVLSNQVKFGSSAQDCHTYWELRGEHEEKPESTDKSPDSILGYDAVVDEEESDEGSMAAD